MGPHGWDRQCIWCVAGAAAYFLILVGTCIIFSGTGGTLRAFMFSEWRRRRDFSKAITNMPTQATGSAQIQYYAVVDGGNFVRLGRFHSTCMSAKIHLEAQEAIIMSKLGVISSSVKYECEISVSKFVNCGSFHRVCWSSQTYSYT